MIKISAGMSSGYENASRTPIPLEYRFTGWCRRDRRTSAKSTILVEDSTDLRLGHAEHRTAQRDVVATTEIGMKPGTCASIAPIRPRVSNW